MRKEVEECHGRNGNESVPTVILKMMFLLFFDDIKIERELMEVISERLDYLWFLDYGLDDKVPDHSLLSKARARQSSDGIVVSTFDLILCSRASLRQSK